MSLFSFGTHLRHPVRHRPALDPLRTIVKGYALYILVGWLLLCLPVCRESSDGSILDHLFTAASAVSTTGLATVGTADTYSGLGEAVILLLIQFGGLGYLTITSFIMLSATGDLSHARKKVSESALGPPQPYILRRYLKMIVVFTAVIELVGAAALYPVFALAESPRPFWQAVFHSISAFCTAGFSLFNNSFEDLRGNMWLNFVVAVLSYLGAIGFIVLHDFYHAATNRARRITLTSKIILWSTLWIGVAGSILFFFDEPSIRELPLGERWLTACFQVMTASTTVGFNTLPIGSIGASSLVLLTVIMIIGASPSGTGGGLKTTTISILWAQMASVARRRESTTFARRAIPESRLRAATASATFYLFVLATGIYLLSLFDSSSWPDQMFECASALGTVGLSRGITGDLTAPGKGVIIALMFLGRVGPVVMGMSLFKPQQITWSYPDEDVVVG
ncbi:MAG: hypothetical protein KF688_06435 [Pirellulales bacterium]|nr:hypothetical protein [Pirellulales bacterium]